ncbi:hypothetical protein Nepgr_023077 [Nepenthes gracilis]|uniref:Uncharacterized protein n=1 Tax=Nepenthes gracilis TaxID=150966 RepID=A0AAD3T1T5_NEPGR|nr:hypothetical protein Nepgr_023077 [Nepenthes gracilis]
MHTNVTTNRDGSLSRTERPSQGHLINHSNEVEFASNQQFGNLTGSISTNLKSSNIQASAGTKAASRSSREYTSTSAEYMAKTYFPMSHQPQAQLQQQSDTRHQKPTSSSQFNPRRWPGQAVFAWQKNGPTKSLQREHSKSNNNPSPELALQSD